MVCLLFESSYHFLFSLILYENLIRIVPSLKKYEYLEGAIFILKFYFRIKIVFDNVTGYKGMTKAEILSQTN